MLFVPRHPLLTLRIFLPIFVPWYFLEVPMAMARKYLEYAHAFGEIFSFVFILRTLFDPWKGIVDSYPITSLNWELIAQAFFLNVTTRAIGFVFRIIALCVGLILQALSLAAFLFCLLLWLTYPALAVFGISSLLLRL